MKMICNFHQMLTGTILFLHSKHMTHKVNIIQMQGSKFQL